MTMRIGFGTDLHRLVPGDGLWIGGIRIPCGFSADAVSDGDALLHALADALLGAAGLGDIGERYPESRVTPGEASSRYVREIMGDLGTKEMRVVNADLIVDLENPKLGEWKASIRESVAGLLGIDSNRVNIKAKSGEGLGLVGRGEAMGAQAAVLVE